MLEQDSLLQAGSPAPTPPVVDLGPLSWVVDSLRDTLHDVRDQLLSFSEEVQAASGSHLTTLDTASLRMAAQSLHEAVGVLDLVERPAAAQVVGAMERSVQLFVPNPERCSPEAAQQLAQAGTAVLDYLDSALKGQPDWSVGLFPVYREVAQLAGFDRIHPADLWHASWQWLEIDEAMPAPAAEARPFLESVLQMFRSGGTQGAAELAAHTQQLWGKTTDSKERVFWQLASGFLQLLSTQALRFDEQVSAPIAAQITEKHLLGNVIRCKVQTDDLSLTVDSLNNQFLPDLTVGLQVSIRLDPRECVTLAR